MIKVGLREHAGGVDFHRLYLPYQGLKGFELEFGEVTLRKGYSWFITHVNTINDATIEACRKQGVKICLDVDDFWELPENHYLYKIYETGQKQKVIHYIKQADLITTTVGFLAGKIREINRNVHVFPNALAENICHVRTYERERLIIGYYGSACHLHDLQTIAGIADYLKGYEKRLQFAIFGVPERKSPHYNEFQEYRKIFASRKDIQLNVPTIPIKMIPYQKPPNYLDMYNYCDIVLAPLADNDFNRAKSPLKLIEAGFFHKPVVCSNVVTFSNVISNKRNGYLCNNANDFASAIVELVENKDLRTQLGNNLFESVNRRFNLTDIRKQRYEFFNQ